MAKQKRNKNVRVCRKCGEEFDIRKTDYLKIKIGYVHTECYIKSLRKKNMLEDSITSAVETIKEIMRVEQEEKDRKFIEQEQKRLDAKKKEISRQRDKDAFFYYIMDKYDRKIPTYFFKKVAEVNSGTHYATNKPISYSDLLFMFKKQESYLDKVRMRNTTLNKEMDAIGCLNYDFAIIVNMYDSYLDWKRKQDIIASDKAREEEIKKQPKIDMDKVSKQAKTSNNDDLSDLLDDLY